MQHTDEGARAQADGVDQVPEPTYEWLRARCPWCQHSIEAWEVDALAELSEDGEHADVECPACDRLIRVELEITVAYSATARSPSEGER